MHFPKPRSKSRVVVGLAIVTLVVGGGWQIFSSDHKSTPSTQTTKPTGVSTGQPAAANNTSGIATTPFIETADFKYELLSGWAGLKKEVLEQAGASSGIGRVANLAATFRTKVSPSTPKDNNELKNSTLDDVKKNAPNFTLLSSVSTKVDGQAGQMFTYSFTDTDGKNKIRQQLSAIPYKGKTFFLLASAVDSDFDKQTGEFKKILDSFRFK